MALPPMYTPSNLSTYQAAASSAFPHEAPGMNNLVDLDPSADAHDIGLGRQLGQVDQYAVRGVRIKVEDLLPQRIGERRVREKPEAPGVRPLDRPGDVRHDIAHMVHDERVVRHVAGVTGLDELRFHLAEMHKDVAPTAGHDATALHGATTGILGPKPVLKPRNGLVQVGYHI